MKGVREGKHEWKTGNKGKLKEGKVRDDEIIMRKTNWRGYMERRNEGKEGKQEDTREENETRMKRKEDEEESNEMRKKAMK